MNTEQREERRESAVAKKIKRRRMFSVCIMILILTVVCLFTPIFNISNISVVGNRVVTEEAVIKASGIKKGTNVFRANISSAKKYICDLGYVEKVEINRKFPSKIVIKITECTETAYIIFAANYVGIDTSGRVISIKKAANVQDAKMTVTGITLKSFKEGSEFVAAKSEKKEILTDVFAAAKKQKIFDEITNINLADIKSIKLTLKNKMTVILGENESLEYKMAYLTEIINNLDEKTRGGTVDLSDTSNVVYKGGN